MSRVIALRPTRRTFRLVALGCFAALAVGLLFPALPLGGQVLGPEDLLFFKPPLNAERPLDLTQPSNYLLADAVEVFHPDLQWARSQLRAGSFPLWNPTVGAGTPQLASQQTAVLFPLNWLALILPFWTSLGLIAAAKIMIAGLGTALLARRSLGLGTAPALLAGVAFAGGSYFFTWLEHPHSNVYALLPWLLFGVDRLIARADLSAAAAFAGLVGLALLGGHPQSVFIVSLLVIAFAVWRIGPAPPLDGRANRSRSRIAALTLVSGIVGVAAGAVMLLPLVEVIGQAEHPARGVAAGMPPNTLYSLILPRLWGTPMDPTTGPGPVNYAERTVYVGAVALMLAVAGLMVRVTRDQLFFCGAALLALVPAIQLPVLTHAVVTAPGFSLVAMTRAIVLLGFALAILAGFGLQRLLDADGAGRRRILLSAAVVGAIPVLWLLSQGGPVLGALGDGLKALPGVPGDVSASAPLRAGAALRWILVAVPALVLLLVWCRRPSAAALLAWGLVALVGADLIAMNRGYHPAIPVERAEPPATASMQFAQDHVGTARVIGEDEYLIPNVATRYGLRDPRLHSVPVLRRYNHLFNQAGGSGYQGTRYSSAGGAGALLDVMGVSLLLRAPESPPPPIASLTLALEAPDGQVYRNRTALPRAYVATSWRSASGMDDAISQTVASNSAQLRTEPVLELSEAPSAQGGNPGGTARFDVDGANTVSLDVDSPRAGVLVLLDTFYPGWTATVDGSRAPVIAANGAFRAVRVPAGRSNVTFEYRPASVLFGAVISVIAWACIGIGLLVPAVRRRRARLTPGD